jgi:hypothetical protein
LVGLEQWQQRTYAGGLRIHRRFTAHYLLGALPVCLCLQARALAAFRLDPEHWGVNVQPYSGR